MADNCKIEKITPTENDLVSTDCTDCTDYGRGQRAEAKNNKGKSSRKCGVVGGAVAEDMFRRGLCLPSGSNMGEAELDRIEKIIKAMLKC